MPSWLNILNNTFSFYSAVWEDKAEWRDRPAAETLLEGRVGKQSQSKHVQLWSQEEHSVCLLNI